MIFQWHWVLIPALMISIAGAHDQDALHDAVFAAPIHPAGGKARQQAPAVAHSHKSDRSHQPDRKDHGRGQGRIRQPGLRGLPVIEPQGQQRGQTG